MSDTKAGRPHLTESEREIEARVEAASIGRWVAWKARSGRRIWRILSSFPGVAEIATVSTETNAALIAHAPADLADLLDEVSRLRAENERQAGEIERLRALLPKPPKFAACVTPGCGDEDLHDLDQTTGLCGMCEREAAILGKAVPRG